MKHSTSTLNLCLNSLKFMCGQILFNNWNINIKCSKRAKSLPVVLTKKETGDLLDAIKNKKHKLMISLMYSAGLRLSELVHLRVKDLEIERDYGWVRGGKGNKDRMFIIAERLKKELKEWCSDLDYGSFVFRGNKGHISQRTIYVIVKRAAKKIKIKKNVHPHTLRHSFATHLIENGYNVYTLQHLLGHSSSETTRTYIHTASSGLINVKSPLDSLVC